MVATLDVAERVRQSDVHLQEDVHTGLNRVADAVVGRPAGVAMQGLHSRHDRELDSCAYWAAG
jgi:hypothetical protein